MKKYFIGSYIELLESLILRTNKMNKNYIKPLGNGQDTDPYIISSYKDLLWMMSASISSGYFTQINDINIPESVRASDLRPIKAKYGPFSVHYDGGGFKISGLYISYQEKNYVGLFGSLYRSEIINLMIENSFIRGSYFVGAFAGEAEDTLFKNCSFIGEIVGNRFIGGFVGLSKGCTIQNSYVISKNCGSNYGSFIGEGYYRLKNSYYPFNKTFINGDNYISHGVMFNNYFDKWLNNNKLLDVNDFFQKNEVGDFLISSPEDLINVTLFAQNSYKFTLTNNIDLKNYNNFYIPYFNGTFNGNKKTISNITINLPKQSNIGLFGYLVDSCINKLTLDHAYIHGYTHIGILAGHIKQSSIRDCYTKGVLKGFDIIGGLVGTAILMSDIRNSWSYSKILNLKKNEHLECSVANYRFFF